MEKHKKDMDSDIALNIALQYHDISENGLFYTLQKEGFVDRLVEDDQITYALDNPPNNTRAWARGKLVEKYKDKLNFNWDCVSTSSIGADIGYGSALLDSILVNGHVKEVLDNPFDTYDRIIKRFEKYFEGNMVSPDNEFKH